MVYSFVYPSLLPSPTLSLSFLLLSPCTYCKSIYFLRQSLFVVYVREFCIQSAYMPVSALRCLSLMVPCFHMCLVACDCPRFIFPMVLHVAFFEVGMQGAPPRKDSHFSVGGLRPSPRSQSRAGGWLGATLGPQRPPHSCCAAPQLSEPAVLLSYSI